MSQPAARELTCPYCGEPAETLVEAPQDGLAYVEDCAICCRPIEFRVSVGPDGALHVDARREDD